MDYSKLSVTATDGSTQSVKLHPLTPITQHVTGLNVDVNFNFEENLLKNAMDLGSAFEVTPSTGSVETTNLLQSDLLVVRASYLWAGLPCDEDDTETLELIIDEQRSNVLFDGYIVATDKAELDTKIQQWCDFQNNKLNLLNSNLNKLSSKEYAAADKKDGFTSMLLASSLELQN
ncbi:TPA: hypothetical protein I7730_00930 [Vibrio vulnificus]|uniref:Uncharacterized protein n=1 Tax=Vibrio vulnificus TaxID=672 RepID=A0A8H9MYC2_VIBVL|nr:hypothetical protein [Vibrio vulnificus]HAS8538363.1 hypothetical protein [Vibrio vulnificus]